MFDPYFSDGLVQPPTCCHPELHPQVLNHEPRGREPREPPSLGVKEIQMMKLKHLHIVILGGGNSNMFFFNLNPGEMIQFDVRIFLQIGLVKKNTSQDLCLGHLRPQKTVHILSRGRL